MLRSPVFRLSMLFPALMLAFCIAIMYGPVTFSMKDVANAILAGYWHSDTAGTLHQRIVWSLRMPRTLLAALAGAALALAGTVLQSLTRNPLADPWVLGISSGAGFGAVLVIALGLSAGWAAVPAGAFCGAMLAFALVLFMARKSLSGQSSRFILTGCRRDTASLRRHIINHALENGCRHHARGDVLAAGKLCTGILASGTALRTGAVADISALLVAGNRAGCAHVWQCDGGVAWCGRWRNQARPVLFIDLIDCGHCGMLRSNRFYWADRASYRPHIHWSSPSFAAAGIHAVRRDFTVLADTLARTLFAPRELPVGILTAMLGVPVFLFLISRTSR